MTGKYVLKYTNGYANYGQIEEADLKIKGDCKITNYDPRENGSKEALKAGAITINFSDGEQTIEVGGDKSGKSREKADFSNKKYSIFKEIAALAGDEDELSIKDIKKIDKSYAKAWGLEEIKLDYKSGVATLVWGEGDILRIDFKTWWEQLGLVSDSSEIEQQSNTPNNTETNTDTDTDADSNIREVYVVKSGDCLAKIAKDNGLFVWEITDANNNLNYNSVLSIGQKIKIPNPIKLPTKLGDLSEGGQKFLKELARKESTNGENPTNSLGYLGSYQMGEKAFVTIGAYKKDDTPEKNDWKQGNWIEDNEFGIKGLDDFLESPEKQDHAVIKYTVLNWLTIIDKGLNKYVGKTIGGIKITESALLAGAHLVGVGGLKTFLESKGVEIPEDEYGTPITEYMSELGNINVSDFTIR